MKFRDYRRKLMNSTANPELPFLSIKTIANNKNISPCFQVAV